MIEHAAIHHASTHEHPPSTAWTRPVLPRGPSPLRRRLARVRAWLARPSAARRLEGCRC